MYGIIIAPEPLSITVCFNLATTLGFTKNLPFIPALAVSTTWINSKILAKVGAPPLVPIVTEPIPAVPNKPVGCPLEPEPLIAAASIATAKAFKNELVVYCWIEKLFCNNNCLDKST